MDFALTEDQRNIRDAVFQLCAQFPDDYWLERDKDAVFPFDFHRAMADAGWLGIAMPEATGGAGLGITEAAIMVEAVAEAGGGMTAASSIHGPVFSLEPIALFGTDEQQQRMIPPIISGAEKMCFAVTEPNTGLDTTKLKTRAERVEGGYRVNGEKIWITNAHVADRMMLLARTTPLDQVKNKTQGLSLFFTRLDRSKIEHQLIPKMGRHAVGSNMLFINDLFIPEEDRIGEEGQGFRIILKGLNPERILLGAEAIGIGTRGAFYDTTGALRDMVPNHLMQLLSMIAMEPPNSFDAEVIRDEKAKLLRAVRRITPDEARSDAVRGMYAAGQVNGQMIPAYRETPHVDPNTATKPRLEVERCMVLAALALAMLR